ncbi:MAG: hypothetical protein U1E63_01715 [Burkholderiales bacterium]
MKAVRTIARSTRRRRPTASSHLLALATTPVAALFASPEVATRLAPLFITDVRRTLRLLKTEHAEIEFALDCGEVRAGERRADLRARTGGAPSRTSTRRAAPQDTVRLRIENRSKAERGHVLAGTASAARARASAPRS